jgi:cytochrome c553
MKSRLGAAVLAAQLLGLGLGYALTTSAAEAPLVGDAAAGAAKAATCAACHGATGNSANPEWPNLAGQHHQYIAEQLGYLKSGVRYAPAMNAMAIGLSTQDMADLAVHFEAQTLTGLEADAGLWKAGEKLYRGGDTARGIPACIGCHGPNGRGNGPGRWPQVRSQHATYVTSQLKNYATQARYVAVAGQSPAPANAQMMYDVAKRLSDEDVRALAAYLQGLR